MSSDRWYVEPIRSAGFTRIGRIEHRLSISAWWKPDSRIGLLVIDIGETIIIKADKGYYLQSISESGQTWARDIPSLHAYLETHLPEVRIAFSHFRDVPANLAESEVRRQERRRGVELPSPERIADLQRRLDRERDSIHRTANTLRLFPTSDDALSEHLRRRTHLAEDAAGELDEQLRRERQRLHEHQRLQQQYQHNGSAAVYTFSIHSNLQVAMDEEELSIALRSVVQEIRDLHRYQITQKLSGGRLQIQIAEADDPAIDWIERWLGGTLSLTQLARIERANSASGRSSRSASTSAPGSTAIPQDHVMVVPDEPIRDHVGAEQCHAVHLGAHVLETLVSRLDLPESRERSRPMVDTNVPALNLGRLIDESGRELGDAKLPIHQIIHGLVSGTTGAGKSVLARVIVEEAAMIEGLGVLVLDPRNQFSGLLVPEDRTFILSAYPEFRMDRARGFAFDYHRSSLPEAPMPTSLASFAEGRHLISFKGGSDVDRCQHAGDILNAVFDQHQGGGESEHPRLLIVIDEAHLFTRRRQSSDEAKQAAQATELAIDQIVREGRKYGIVLVAVTQSMRDFSRDLASVRQMTSTKVFLRNADNEIDYAADVLGDGKPLINLPTGVAILHNASIGTQRIRIRPPLSKVCELEDGVLCQLLKHPPTPSAKAISDEATSLLERLRAHCAAEGPVNISQAARLAGITSRRRILALVDELERAALLRSHRLPDAGRPRVISPT